MSLRASALASLFVFLGLACVAQVNDIRNFSNPGNGSVTGSVRAIDNRPIPNARVDLRSTDHSSVLGSTRTNELGSFELHNVPPGQYEIVATIGISEARERVTVSEMDAQITLRVSTAAQEAGSSETTVSVAEYKVPDKARKEFEKAEKLMRESKLKESRERVEKALSIYPRYANALTLRGILKLSDNQAEEGLKDLDDAIKADPSYGMAYTAMGAAYNHLGKYNDAVRVLERGAALQPDAWQVYFELAKSNLGLGDYKTALKNATRAREMTAEYPPIHLVKAHALLGLRQYPDAVSELESYLSREPNSPNSASAREALDKAKAFVQTGMK